MTTCKDFIPSSKGTFGCFMLDSNFQSDQKARKLPRARAKYTPQRRKEVASMRGKSCLRCRLLKKRCSGHNPCQGCLSAATSSTQSQQLQFSYCVRTSLKDLSIFSYTLPPSGETETIIKRANSLISLISAPIDFGLPSEFQWNLGSVFQYMSSWILDPSNSSASKVGILSSTRFQRLIAHEVGLRLSHSFQLMLFASTAAYNQQWDTTGCQYDYRELQQVASIAGEYVLDFLQKSLTSAELDRHSGSIEYLQSLFLILIGTILAVSYFRPTQAASVLANDPHTGATTNTAFFESVQEHLCATLAHYMIYLGHKTHNPLGSLRNEHIITRAHKRWLVPGYFQWTTASNLRQTSESLTWKCGALFQSDEQYLTTLRNEMSSPESFAEGEVQDIATEFINDQLHLRIDSGVTKKDFQQPTDGNLSEFRSCAARNKPARVQQEQPPRQNVAELSNRHNMVNKRRRRRSCLRCYKKYLPDTRLQLCKRCNLAHPAAHSEFSKFFANPKRLHSQEGKRLFLPPFEENSHTVESDQSALINGTIFGLESTRDSLLQTLVTDPNTGVGIAETIHGSSKDLLRPRQHLPVKNSPEEPNVLHVEESFFLKLGPWDLLALRTGDNILDLVSGFEVGNDELNFAAVEPMLFGLLV